MSNEYTDHIAREFVIVAVIYGVFAAWGVVAFVGWKVWRAVDRWLERRKAAELKRLDPFD